MGYEVQITKSTATVPEAVKDEVLQIWKDLNKPENDHLKRGGSWRNGVKNTSWYSWLDSKYDEKVESVEEMLSELGFETSTDELGNVAILEFEGKRGQEQLFFKNVSYLLKGHIEWVGEDGLTWVWVLGEHCNFE